MNLKEELEDKVSLIKGYLSGFIGGTAYGLIPLYFPTAERKSRERNPLVLEGLSEIVESDLNNNFYEELYQTLKTAGALTGLALTLGTEAYMLAKYFKEGALFVPIITNTISFYYEKHNVNKREAKKV